VGNTALTETNAGEIFNYIKEGDVKDYAFQESLGLAVFKQISSISSFTSNIEVMTALYNSVQTNVPISELSRYASLLFAHSSYNDKAMTYPTTNDYSSTNMKIPDWSNGINQIKSAEK
jgi:anionic cell wall polymer biosynthesis LytR-Cps2A-Psr (LCP) family protein